MTQFTNSTSTLNPINNEIQVSAPRTNYLKPRVPVTSPFRSLSKSPIATTSSTIYVHRSPPHHHLSASITMPKKAPPKKSTPKQPAPTSNPPHTNIFDNYECPLCFQYYEIRTEGSKRAAGLLNGHYRAAHGGVGDLIVPN